MKPLESSKDDIEDLESQRGEPLEAPWATR